MSRIEGKPDLSEALRAFESFAKGEVTLEDVAKTAKEIAEEAASDGEKGSAKAKKTGTSGGPSVENSAVQSTIEDKNLKKIEEGGSPEEIAASQEQAGVLGASFIGAEISNVAPLVGKTPDKPDGSVTVAELDRETRPIKA